MERLSGSPSRSEKTPADAPDTEPHRFFAAWRTHLSLEADRPPTPRELAVAVEAHKSFAHADLLATVRRLRRACNSGGPHLPRCQCCTDRSKWVMERFDADPGYGASRRCFVAIFGDGKGTLTGVQKILAYGEVKRRRAPTPKDLAIRASNDAERARCDAVGAVAVMERRAELVARGGAAAMVDFLRKVPRR